VYGILLIHPKHRYQSKTPYLSARLMCQIYFKRLTPSATSLTHLWCV